jgi:hypothetical protein
MHTPNKGDSASMRRIVIAAVLGALALATAAVTGGLAASGSKQAASGPPPTLKQFRTDRLKERDAHLDRVAKRVGKTGDELRSAIDAVRDEQLDALVKAGKLTAAQRAAIKACETAPLTCDRSNLPAPRFERGERRGFGPHRLGGQRRDLLAAVAQKLGVETSALQKAFRAERPTWHDGRRGHDHGPGPGRFGPGGAVGPAPGGDVPGGGPEGLIGA